MSNGNAFEKQAFDFINRAVAIMDGVAGGNISIRQLYATTGLPRTTIIRVAAQLVDQGVLTAHRNGDDIELKIQIGAAPPQ